MTKQLDNSMYYSLDRALTYQALVNLIMSNRGGGKTYNSKVKMIKNFINKGKQSVYVRRYKSEFEKITKTFCEDIKHEFPNNELKVDGMTVLVDGEIAIYFIPLSTATKEKSTAYPNVNMMVFDEYIIEKTTYGRYLKNEVYSLFGLMETVFRSRDDKDNRIILLANKVSYVNPLFTEFNIEPKRNKRFQTFEDGLILVEEFTNQDFIDYKKQTRMGNLFMRTKFGKYAIENETLEDSDDFIEPNRIENLVFTSSLKMGDYEIGVWMQNHTGILYIDKKVDFDSKYRFALRYEDVSNTHLHITEGRKDWRVSQIKRRYGNSQVIFQNQEVKKFFLEEVMKYL